MTFNRELSEAADVRGQDRAGSVMLQVQDEPHQSIYEQADVLLAKFEATPLAQLLSQARALREEGHGRVVSYSRKVFIPLTRLCRDTCAYCTFATVPSKLKSAFLSPEEVLSIAKSGVDAGCHEALFTLGDKPELQRCAALL